MEKIIEVSCPLDLNLFLNIENFNETGITDFKLINQTVELEKKANVSLNANLVLKSNIENDDLCFVISKDQLSIKEKGELIYAYHLFIEYTKIIPRKIIIKISKGVLGNFSFNSLLAGFILALNAYYNTELSIKELLKIGYQLNYTIAYLISGGYKKITNNGNNINTITEKNPYQEYLIVESDDFNLDISSIKKALVTIVNNETHNLYSDYLQFASAKLIELNKFLDTLNLDIKYSLSGNKPLYVITSLEPSLLFNVQAILKKEFPNYQIYMAKNTTGHKVLKRYLQINH